MKVVFYFDSAKLHDKILQLLLPFTIFSDDTKELTRMRKNKNCIMEAFKIDFHISFFLLWIKENLVYRKWWDTFHIGLKQEISSHPIDWIILALNPALTCVVVCSQWWRPISTRVPWWPNTALSSPLWPWLVKDTYRAATLTSKQTDK